LIPSFFIVAAFFVWRACQKPDASLSLNTLMGASPARAGAVSPATAPSLPPRGGVSIRQVARPATPQAAHRDDFAALLPLATDCFNFMQKQPGFIVSEVKGAGVDTMLQPAFLENAKQLDASRARLKRLSDRLASYETRIRKVAADLTEKANASGAPEKIKANFLSDVRRSGGEFVRGVLEFAIVQRKYLAATDEMLAFLRARTDKFTVINRRPMFANAADSRKYDALRKSIDDLGARGDQLVATLRSKGERAIRELNSPSDADTPLQARAGVDGGS
jgi:hypothetical protein